MEYDAIAYAQFGDYHCPHYGWIHVPHDDRNDEPACRYGFAASTSSDGYGTRHHSVARALYGDEDATIAFHFGGLYMDYNAVAAIALIDSITHNTSKDATDDTHAYGKQAEKLAAT